MKINDDMDAIVGAGVSKIAAVVIEKSEKSALLVPATSIVQTIPTG